MNRAVRRSSARETAAADPVEPFFKILLMLRWVTLVVTIVLNLARLPVATSVPVLVVACVVMLLATMVVTVASTREPQTRRYQAWSEVGVAFVLVLMSPLALPPDHGSPPLTGFWVAAGAMSVVLACGWGQGVAASLLLGGATMAVAPALSLERWGLMATLIACGAALGRTVDLVRTSIHEREDMRVTNAALAERQRLARIVHDGVLQVLAMVEREGRHLGPRGAMLARHAQESEVQLRALIQQTDIDPESRDPRDITHRNFAVLLDQHASATVSVATPVEPLLMESARAYELNAVVTEALNNVAKHAGPDAKAWLFLEIDGNEATVSVRDNGVGGDPNQFAEAMRNGRMGMKHSIYGRIQDLGGTAALRAAPGRGVEWEFHLPIEV